MRIFIILLIFCLPFFLVGQSRSKLEKERNAIIKKIEQTDKILRLTKMKSSNALKNLELVKNEIEERKTLIDNYNSELEHSQKTVSQLQKSRDSLFLDIQQNKNSYLKLLTVEHRKKMLDNKWLYIFSAQSFSEALLRYRYKEQYKSYIRNKLALLKTQTEAHHQKLKSLNIEHANKKTLLDNQKKNYQSLEQKRVMKKELVNGLKKDQKSLVKTLKKAKSRRKQLNNEIEKAILESMSKANVSKNKVINATVFESAKKRLPWPLDNAIISSKFGVQSHSEISSVKITNNGIDLISSSNNKVKAVFKGVVIAKVETPTNGIMIILQHGIYYSVYSNLIQCSLNINDQVKQDSIIGKIEKNNSLHFELWKNKTKLNPQHWLK